jgi:hypothetical protein
MRMNCDGFFVIYSLNVYTASKIVSRIVSNLSLGKSEVLLLFVVHF